jgi:hypothetical protein
MSIYGRTVSLLEFQMAPRLIRLISSGSKEKEPRYKYLMDERKTNLIHLLYIFIVAVGDALHVSGVFAHRQER